MAQLQGDAWHFEQKRSKYDKVRVYNPTDEDYQLIWIEDGQKQTFIFPNKNKDTGFGKGMKVIDAYLAKKYTKEMVDKLIIAEGDKKLEEMKEELRRRGTTDVEYFANDKTKFSYMVTDPKLREPWEDKIWLGVEEYFGLERIETIDEPKPQGMIDPMDRLMKKSYKPSYEPETIIEKKGDVVVKTQKVKHDLSDVAEG